MPDPNLQRFVDAQRRQYDDVVAELRAGEKLSHWMWYIFPQVHGLGMSPMSIKYAIASKAEAIAYALHPILGKRLYECTQLVLDVHGRSALDIFSTPDDMKFHSSMTLFERTTQDKTLFTAALKKYFDGKPDRRTLEILDGLN
jgi:uncharacterized protein (DUF1810 family)